MQAKTEQGIKEVNILQITPENYVVPEGEENLFHCIIEVRKFSSETGARISKPRLQKFGKKVFKTIMNHQLKLQGYTVTILHDPEKWETEHEAELKAKKAAAAEMEKAKAEEAAKLEREKIKAELLAEVLAELKEKENSKGKKNNE